MNKKILLFFTLMIMALIGASVVSASPDVDNVTVDNYNGDDVALDAISYVEPITDDTNSVDDTICYGENVDCSSNAVDSSSSQINQCEINNTTIDDGKTNNQTDIQGPKINTTGTLNITGPKINASDLDIKGPVLVGSFSELQNQINAAKAGSVLYLFKDYKGKSGEVINLNKDLTINGLGNTIDCRGEKNCRAFYSTSGNIVLKNLNIINGKNEDTDKGGAIQIMESAKYTIINCTFKNNWAEKYGGAIYNGVNKKLSIINSSFIGNTANSVDGGAIYSEGVIDIEDSLFKSNVADEYGGAIACKKNMYLLNAEFIGNVARSRDWSWYEYIYHWVDNPYCRGGAIYCSENVSIYNGLFENNTSADHAGAIWANVIDINRDQDLFNTPTTIFRNNIAGNKSGGAIYANKCMRAMNTLFDSNEAYVDGGAIFAWNNVTLKNCNFQFNKAEGSTSQCYGGAIRCKDDDTAGNVYIENCAFFKNYAYDYGGAIYADNIYINDKQSDDGKISTYFQGNIVADNEGGALYADKEVIVKNALFEGNEAYGSGGGIYAKGDVNAYHCEFNNNSALNGINANGGGIYSKSNVNVENSTFTNNYAKGVGPAIYAIENININQNSNGKNYRSHFANNKASYTMNQDQIVCDKDHGKIKYINTDFS